ncbi:heme oxygenase [Streptomyces sp. CB02923]|nr:heme oxygenase [Streptomyces sp. CB02923]
MTAEDVHPATAAVPAHPGLRALERRIGPAREHVLSHRVYGELTSLRRVAVFQEHHVFAVWDFMSLLKSLQRDLTCTDLPWVPQGPSVSRRLINEITLAEESDAFGDGYTSHFELYVDAMRRTGADTGPIESFVALLRDGNSVTKALKYADVPPGAAEFTAATWDVIAHAPLHCRAAAFAFGREDLIPDMFQRVTGIAGAQERLATFKDYLVRHIELDGDAHTPMALRMLVEICGDDREKWAQGAETVVEALRARQALWDAVSASSAGR